VLRYRVSRADGRRVENTMPVGLVSDFPKERDVWREVDALGLPARINDAPCPVRIRFDALAEHYLMADFGEDAVRSKSENTAPSWGTSSATTSLPAGVMRRRRISNPSMFSAG
jgi:integrase